MPRLITPYIQELIDSKRQGYVEGYIQGRALRYIELVKVAYKIGLTPEQLTELERPFLQATRDRLTTLIDKRS